MFLKEEDERKTAFCTRYGHFEYYVMPFRLTNLSAIFQHLMNDVFREYLNRFVLCYLVSILIYSKNIEEHVECVKLVLQKLREKSLFAKVKECAFLQPKVESLGYVISSVGLLINPKKFKEWQNRLYKRQHATCNVFLALVFTINKYLSKDILRSQLHLSGWHVKTSVSEDLQRKRHLKTSNLPLLQLQS